MPNAFETAFKDRVSLAANRAFGVMVNFVRGKLATDEFQARRGDREYTAVGQEYGIEVTILMRDFMLPVASLLIDGDAVEPRTGDRIIDNGETFEISPPDENRPSVELRPGSADYLVHTKRIK